MKYLNFTKQSAVKYAYAYSFLIGYPMPSPFDHCTIDSFEVIPLEDGGYDVLLKHDIYSKSSIPEFFGLYQTIRLDEYLRAL